MLYVVLTMPTLNKAYLFIYLFIYYPLSFNGIYKVAVAVQRQRVIYTENSGFASPALGSARFVAIGFYFLSESLI
jgi:hypothetical protein